MSPSISRLATLLAILSFGTSLVFISAFGIGL